ncbi:MAG TPA: hypothetical protein VH395_06815 [Jatrophihabitantaceae bacterium]|jgi:hypothetical protein
MSITVVIARDDVGAPSTREVYETGVKYSAEGGDLSIFSAKPQLLATYGSGNWLSVYVDDNVEVISTKPEESDSGFDDFSFGDDSSDSDDSSSDDAGSDEDSSTE